MANTLFNSMKQKYGKWIGEMDTNSGIKIVGWFEGQNPRTDKVKEFKTFAEAKKWGATRDNKSTLDKAIKTMDANIEKEIRKYINEMAKIISPNFMTEQNIKDGIKKVDKLAKEIGKTLESMKRRGEISSDGYAYYASKVDSVLKNANKKLYERLHETKDTKDAVKGYGSFFQPSDFSKTSKKELLDAYKKAREEYLKDIKNQAKFRAFKDAERACKMYGIRV